MNKLIIFLVSSIMLLFACGDSSKTTSSQTEHQQHDSSATHTQNTEQATTQVFRQIRL